MSDSMKMADSKAIAAGLERVRSSIFMQAQSQ